jgi:hypothetical protein
MECWAKSIALTWCPRGGERRAAVVPTPFRKDRVEGQWHADGSVRATRTKAWRSGPIAGLNRSGRRSSSMRSMAMVFGYGLSPLRGFGN